tara:strand:+ start:28983 stop:29354 length:372 start_codon:yes stop_codon:yes gene_type:complete
MVINELDTSKLKYDNLINYRICEELFISFKKMKKYNSFNSMCNNFRELIDNNIKIYGELNIILDKTIKNITELYNLERWEVINLIFDFFIDRKWESYQPIVEVLLKSSYIEDSIKKNKLKFIW